MKKLLKKLDDFILNRVKSLFYFCNIIHVTYASCNGGSFLNLQEQQEEGMECIIKIYWISISKNKMKFYEFWVKGVNCIMPDSANDILAVQECTAPKTLTMKINGNNVTLKFSSERNDVVFNQIKKILLVSYINRKM